MSFALPLPFNEENLDDNMEFGLDLDEYFQEMTEENLQPMGVQERPQDDELVGESGMELINEAAIDEEVAKHANFAAIIFILIIF